MPIIISLFSDIFHFIKMLLVCEMFFMFNKREIKNKKVSVILITAIVIFVSITMYFCNNPIINMMVYCVFNVGLFLSIYKEKTSKLIISIIWIVFIVSLLDIMSRVLVKMQHFLFGFTSIDFDNIIASFLSMIFVLVSVALFKKKSRVGIKSIEKKYLLSFLVFAVAGAVIVTLIASKVEDIANIYLAISLCIVIIGMFVQLAFLIVLFTHKIILTEQKQLIEKYLDAQENHYEYLKNKELETKKFRHDLRSHMQMIKEMTTQGKFDLVKEYIEERNYKVEALESKVSVHNEIVDAIINQYYAIANSKGITMEVVGKFPVKCNISAYDLCTIFSNILINAIEAAQNGVDKKIKLICGNNEDGEVFIKLSNTYNTSINRVGNRIVTTKSDREFHGFGLGNVNDCVNKYDGIIDIYILDEVFYVEIMLKDIERNGKNEDCSC